MIVTIFTTISQKGDPVKISTKTRYGMRFMIDLAQSQGEGRVALKDIADRQGLSKKYLEQVVAPLASAGLLDVTRGNQGGYRLSRDASAITLADIVAAVDGRAKILVDGGIRTGSDVFKALALGADAVLIARPFVTAVYGAGADGVAAYAAQLGNELADTMRLCGAPILDAITRDMVRIIK